MTETDRCDRIAAHAQQIVMHAIDTIDDIGMNGLEFFAHMVAMYCKAHEDEDEAWQDFSMLVEQFLPQVERPAEVN